MPVPAPAAQSTSQDSRATAKMTMMEIPADKRQLERLLAMGYSVHENHMHPPGVKNCPFDMGGSVVQ
jgi:tRNA G26 N,N-dimethylase Trm1